jgi:hypothetical protein
MDQRTSFGPARANSSILRATACGTGRYGLSDAVSKHESMDDIKDGSSRVASKLQEMSRGARDFLRRMLGPEMEFHRLELIVT